MVENLHNNKLFVIFSIIFLSLMASNYALNRSFVKEILINEQLSILKNSSERVERWIENKKRSLQAINVLAAKFNPQIDAVTIKNILTQSLAIANFSSVYAGYENGETISSREFNRPINYDPRLRPWYINTLKNKDIYVTKPYMDVGLKVPVISICEQIKHDNKTRGVICGILSFSDVKNEILNLQLENGGYIFLIDESQNILLHPNESFEGNVLEPKIAHLSTQKALHYDTAWHITTTIPLSNSKLILVATTLKKDIYNKINEQFLRNFAIYAISACLFIFLGYFYNKNIQSQNQLLKKTKQEYEILLFSQTKMAELGQMIAAISHQWIQPLNSLGIFLGNLVQFKKLGRLSDDVFYDNIDRSLKNIDYMTNTMNMFKNFYKVEEKPQNFSVYTAINDTIFILFPQHSKINIKVVVKKGLICDCNNYINEFKQIIACLIQNSKQALSENQNTKRAKIVVSIKDDKSFFQMHIVDNAGGIKSGFEDKIFKPFLSTKNSSGLGLYVSKLIAQKKCGGDLKLVKNAKPTIFSLTILKDINA
ncbi:sensor histidine kinase [Campylobacter mucosalis]|uniref:sensor histidine kinase n=1 Tax=Campylobacter mucosalis TaxID=202 RepID=UPI0014706FE1|nr:sensor histidine kinase [Campylobacter mucosalis]